ncbi:MAG: SH3 domain-containing protein [Chloroflexi bacterium]|nr:SH3 domain-containing protein [Chloroflexota bacterium]
MTHLTLLANSPSYGEGAAIRQWDGSAVLRNSVVVGRGWSRLQDCYGNVDVSRGNFSQDGTCGSLTAEDPMLGEMTGAPGYFPPIEGSPLVDAADAQFCLATDQAGKPRPIGGGCDIGASEYGEASTMQLASVAASADPRTCRVTTTHVLNFRDGPAGNRIGLVPANATLTASARESGWFKVDYRGVSGWISADYVTTAGVCG